MNGDLSGDDDPAPATAQGSAGEARPKVSVRAAARSEHTGKRSRPTDIPIPLSFKKTDDGKYQEYKLPEGRCVYQRRQFEYLEEHKQGQPVVQKPPPPKIFPTHAILNSSAKSLAQNAGTRALTSSDMLNRRLEARVIRVASNYFQHDDLSVPPTTDAVDILNEKLTSVFGDDVDGWTRKQIMAFAWPEIPLIGNALEYHGKVSGHLANEVRVTERLIAAVLLSADGGDVIHASLFNGAPNRFAVLTGSMKEAAMVLSTVLRKGVVQSVDSGNNTLKLVDNLDKLFTEHHGVRGKDGKDAEEGDYQKGDPMTVQLFEPRNGSESITLDDVEYEVITIQVLLEPTSQHSCVAMLVDRCFPCIVVHPWQLDEQAIVLFKLCESELNKTLMKLELTLPPKSKTFAAGTKRARGGPMSRPKMTKEGHAALEVLESMLPAITLAELKKLIKKVAPDATPPTDKAGAIRKVIELVLPRSVDAM